MNEQALEARRAYKREWNRKNKEKVKAAQARYWERKAAAAAEAAAVKINLEEDTAGNALQGAAAQLSGVTLTPADLEGLSG